MYHRVNSRLASAFPPILPPLFEMAEVLGGYLIGKMCAIMNEKNKKEGNVRQRNYMHSLAQLQRLFTGRRRFRYSLHRIIAHIFPGLTRLRRIAGNALALC